MTKNDKKWQKMKNAKNDKEKGNYECNLGHKKPLFGDHKKRDKIEVL